MYWPAAFPPNLFNQYKADAERGAAKFAGYTLNDLQNGMALYAQNCKGCHGLKSPTSRTEEEWRKIVPDMVKKVNKKRTKLAANDEEMILKYVITMSGK